MGKNPLPRGELRVGPDARLSRVYLVRPRALPRGLGRSLPGGRGREPRRSACLKVGGGVAMRLYQPRQRAHLAKPGKAARSQSSFADARRVSFHVKHKYGMIFMPTR